MPQAVLLNGPARIPDHPGFELGFEARLPRLIGSLFHRPDGFLIDSVCSGTQHVYESFLIFSEAESTRSLTWE
jgi:hypothetical protein